MKRQAVENTYRRYGEIKLESYEMMGNEASLSAISDVCASVYTDAAAFITGLKEAGIEANYAIECHVFALYGGLKVACQVTALTGCLPGVPTTIPIPPEVKKKLGIR